MGGLQISRLKKLDADAKDLINKLKLKMKHMKKNWI